MSLCLRGKKTQALLASFLFLTSIAFAQSPYRGGQGDGYASQKGRVMAIGGAWARVYPSPVARGEEIQIYATGDLSELSVELFDVQGKLLISRKWTEWTDERSLKLPTQAYAPGCYLVRVFSTEKSFSQKLIVWEE